MKKLMFALAALAMPLAACNWTPPASPGDVANKTTLDEKAGITATVAYTTASTFGATLVRAGVIDKDQFKALDNKGYAAVTAIKTAYDAGNAVDYTTAINDANAAVAQIEALVK